MAVIGWFATGFLLAVVAPIQSAAAESTTDYSAELPRIAPLEPGEAIESFQLLDGFRVELVAAEPLVASPVAMAFDEDGRLFIVEMRDYSEHDKESLGRVRLLEDSDGDGRMDRSTVYADGLSWPTAVICWDGGVLVGAAPDILYLKDTDGDGKADLRKTVFTGFGRSNVQGLLNSFLWGLDNRIHGSTSSSGGTVGRVSRPSSVGGGNDRPPQPITAEPPVPLINLSGRDFAFDPRTLGLASTGPSSQHGASFDDWGVRFVCSNSDHLQMVIDDRSGAGPGSILPPPSRLSIAADGGQAEVFRISPVELWRVVRTRLRASGQVPGPLEGGGRAAGYFTSATGLTVYRGDAWPAEFRGHVFVADVGSNLIHRKALEPRGVTLVGRRIDEGREFLASTDNWFRPVQMANAPDGNLWVIDMYREVIEHPASLPPIIKQHLDLDSGRERGRIYRIVRDGAAARPAPRLSAAPTEQLIALLAHPNAWHRETAARLIYQRQERSAVEPLERMALHSKSPLGRLHALYALHGLSALSPAIVLDALHDEHPRVAEHAIMLAEPWEKYPDIARKLLDLAASAQDLRIVWRATGTIGDLPDRVAVINDVLHRHAGDPWIRYAALTALGGEVADALESLLAIGGKHILIEELARLVDARDLERVRQLISYSPDPLSGTAATRGLVARHGSARLADLIAWAVPECQKIVLDTSRSAADRAEATRTLALDDPERVTPVLVRLSHPRQPPAVQAAAVEALARFDAVIATTALLDALPGSQPALRPRILDALAARPARAAALLEAVEAGRLTAAQIGPEHRARLVSHGDATIRDRATKLLAVDADRARLVDQYTREMANLRGDAARGREIFAAACAACHKVGGTGYELGPSLPAFIPRGSEAIVLNVLDPNREVNPQFVNYIVATTDGRTLAGLIASETDAALTLTAGAGVEHILPRGQIATMTSTGQSLMPVGLEAAITPQGMADLIAFLTSGGE